MLTRQAAAPVIAMILIYGVLLGCQPTQQSETTAIVTVPSPTWLFRPTSLTAVLTPTPVADSDEEKLAGKTVVAGSHTEASGQPTPMPHPDQVKQGQRLFYEVGCFHCHGVQAGGAVGPRIARTDMSLDAVIHQVYLPAGDMPAFSEEGVSESDVAAIYAYLQSLEPPGPRPEITSDRPDPATGEALYRFFGCFGCHGYQAEGGFGAPLVGTELSLADLIAQVRKPRERMPAYTPERISDEELACIYAFIESMAPDQK